MKYLFASLVLVLLLSGAGSASAQCNGVSCTYTPLERIPGQSFDAINDTRSFGDYITSMFRVFIVLGGMFAVATFVFGGITYMTAEVVGKKDWGKKQMQRAVYGILILLGSYLLLYTINPDLVKFRFNPGDITNVNQPTNSNTGDLNGNASNRSSTPTASQINACEGSGRARIAYAPGGGWVCTPNNP